MKKAGLIILALIIIAVGAYFILLPKADASTQLESILTSAEELAATNAQGIHPAISESFIKNFSLELDGDIKESFRRGQANISVSYLDAEALVAGLAPELQALLAQYVEQALRPSEIYDEENAFLPDVLERAYTEALENRLLNAQDYYRNTSIRAELKYSSGSWTMTNAEALTDYSLEGFEAMPGFEQATAELEHIEFRYKLADWTSPGPVPNGACYGASEDPAKIMELCSTDMAQKLINGQTLDFAADRDFIPGSPIRYYLDETIFTIVWQEVEHGAVATFAEVFISDASQLRRKLADDSFGCQSYYYPTQLAKESNAVLAVSGDFYDFPDRVYGLYAYNGQLLRSRLDAGQSCLFTDTGEMIFTYENQFSTEAEAQAYLDENNIMFSLSFGPVLVDKGVDVTPYSYPLGEILDTYARCAIGQLGERHYLAMTINVQSPNYYVYVTLRQAADSMIAHGCYNAYTLDGGQTGSIILGGKLINPVQFGVERNQSDIFYFATAIPS